MLKKGVFKRAGEFRKQYILLDKHLGRGAYGSVTLGKDKRSNEQVAVKIMNKEGFNKKQLAKIEEEVRILTTVDHKNIVRIFNAYIEKKEIYVVMEYLNGGNLLEKILDKSFLFTEQVSRKVIHTLALAMEHCKSKGVVHRDLKPDNIMVTGDDASSFEIKIIDFNLSKKVEPEQITHHILQTMCGTPNFVAPEVISGLPYDFKCDVWSIGVIMFLMLSGGFMPFPVANENKSDLLAKIQRGKWSFTPEHAWYDVSDNAKDLLKKVLVKNVDARFDYIQILGHPWFKEDPDNLTTEIDTSKLKVLNEHREKLSAFKRHFYAEMVAEEARERFAGLMESDDEGEENDVEGIGASFDPFNNSFLNP